MTFTVAKTLSAMTDIKALMRQGDIMFESERSVPTFLA
jgi:hypothetical protein